MAEPRIRCSVVDVEGTVSLVGPAHILKVFAASCAMDPRDHRELFAGARRYDEHLIDALSLALRVFDEHNTTNDHGDITRRLSADASFPLPFRVLDELTRRASLRPVEAGLVVFNLPAHRIVQIQNNYADLQRQDRGRIRKDGKPTRSLFQYKLPNQWSILP